MQKFITSWCYHIQSTTNHGSILARKYWKLSKLDNLKLYIYLLCFSSLERLQEEFFFCLLYDLKQIPQKWRKKNLLISFGEEKVFFTFLCPRLRLIRLQPRDSFNNYLSRYAEEGKSNKKFSRFFFFFGTLNVIVLLTKFLFFSCCS